MVLPKLGVHDRIGYFTSKLTIWGFVPSYGVYLLHKGCPQNRFSEGTNSRWNMKGDWLKIPLPIRSKDVRKQKCVFITVKRDFTKGQDQSDFHAKFEWFNHSKESIKDCDYITLYLA